ncbi:MAG: caspase family protein, partial [Deltaproteobacteria bacterium]|nr:caspase family protein [Deltaproteobacteria bacterium]
MKTKILFLLLAIVAGWALPASIVVRGFSLANSDPEGSHYGISLASAEERAVTIKPKKGADTAAPSNINYHALIIGSNNYKYLPKLKTAIADAKAVEDILKNKYGFKTKLLIDATR